MDIDLTMEALEGNVLFVKAPLSYKQYFEVSLITGKYKGGSGR